MAQRKCIRLGIMKLRVRSLTLFSGLRIWRCRELWCRLQTGLGSHVVVAQAGSGSSDLNSSLGTSTCHKEGPKKQKRKKKKKKEFLYIF